VLENVRFVLFYAEGGKAVAERGKVTDEAGKREFLVFLSPLLSGRSPACGTPCIPSSFVPSYLQVRNLINLNLSW